MCSFNREKQIFTFECFFFVFPLVVWAVVLCQSSAFWGGLDRPFEPKRAIDNKQSIMFHVGGDSLSMVLLSFFPLVFFFLDRNHG